jgi:serine/threonine protein kinase
MNEETLFHLAQQQPDAAARAAFLDQACAGQPELRARLEKLLQAHDHPASLLDRPPLEAAAVERQTQPSHVQEAVGGQIGPYKLLQKLGEGGMGVVWVAEQTEPVRRRVALKVIKPGMDSAQVLRRFEQERQALALMDHTNIARVLDAGATSSGRPYFVMELVKGIPITEYCDELHLTLPERLALFLPVCRAIQHAHQKGIIHRDIKPSNVLVAVQDGQPVPKVIDFGVAKALRASPAEQSLVTEIGQVIGTLEYMSPEQAELSALDIDTRADVYALGVLLYELLTGTTPLDRKRLRRAAYAEMLRIIKEEEPPRPSTRLTESREALASAAAQRRTEPTRLQKEVRGELDWIVMRCLEKDRKRRYDTPSSLARDLERHLQDEPVEACPPSRGYRLRKFVRKHRAAAVTTVVLAGLLMVAAAVSVWQAARARDAEQRARDAARAEAAQRLAAEKVRDDAMAARQLAAESEHKAMQAADAERKAKAQAEQAAEAERKAAEAERKAREMAQKRLQQIEKANEILSSIFRDLDPRAEIKQGQPLLTQLGERLDKAAELLKGESIGDPLAVARLQLELGHAQLNLGYPERAITLFTKARQAMEANLGPDHPDTLLCTNCLALAYRAAGQLSKALPLYEQALAKMKTHLGPDHPSTLRSMNYLAEAYQAAGQPAKALPLLEQALERMKDKLGADHPDTLTTMNNLGTAYLVAGQPDKALPLLEQVLQARQARLGPDHPNTLTSMDDLAVAYQKTGQADKALLLLEQALVKRQTMLGAEHPDTLASLDHLAAAYQDTGQLDKALVLFEQALVKRNAKLGPNHPQTLASMGHLAAAYLDAGQLDKAFVLLEQTLQKRQAQLGPDHPDTLSSLFHLAEAYVQKQRPAEAQALLETWIARQGSKLAADDPGRAAAYTALGECRLMQKSFAAAEKLLRESLTIYQQKQAKAVPRYHTESLLGAALAGEKNYAAAEPLLLSSANALKENATRLSPANRQRMLAAIQRVIDLYEAWQRPDDAARWRKELEVAKASAK